MSYDKLESWCTKSNGSENTYYCDILEFIKPVINSPRMIIRHGRPFDYKNIGLSYINVNSALHNAHNYTSTFLCEFNNDPFSLEPIKS